MLKTIILVVYICLLSACSDSQTLLTTVGPKPNDVRIVQNQDGSFSLQYYWDQPGWRLTTGIKYRKIEEARAAKKTWESPSETKVVE